MTCPHCGATAREHERFCPKCSRLINSPLLKMRQELDAARAAMQRDRPAPLAKASASQGQRTPVFQPQAWLPAAGAPVTPSASRNRKNEARKAEIRARLAASRGSVAAPPPMPREVHTADSHETVRDDTLERARRGQGAGSSEALERARHEPSKQPPASERPSSPPRRQKGSRPTQGESQPQHDKAERPTASSGGRLTPALSVLLLLNLAVLIALFAGVTALDGMPEGSIGHNIAEAARVAAYVLGGIVALATLGLWTMQPFGRALQRLASVFWLPVFPFGTLFAFVALLFLGSRGVRLLFSGRQGGEFTPAEQVLLTRTRRYAPVMAILLLLLGGLAMGNLVGGVATLDAPLREPGTLAEVVGAAVGGAAPAGPTDPREAMLADLEAYAEGQSVYAQANGGYYDLTECLVTQSCVPGQAAVGTGLDARFLEPVRHGYEFRLGLGPTPGSRGESASATSTLRFAYFALPVEGSPDTWGYCIERYRTICRLDPALITSPPPFECPAECEFVR